MTEFRVLIQNREFNELRDSWLFPDTAGSLCEDVDSYAQFSQSSQFSENVEVVSFARNIPSSPTLSHTLYSPLHTPALLMDSPELSFDWSTDLSFDPSPDLLLDQYVIFSVSTLSSLVSISSSLTSVLSQLASHPCCHPCRHSCHHPCRHPCHHPCHCLCHHPCRHPHRHLLHLLAR